LLGSRLGNSHVGSSPPPPVGVGEAVVGRIPVGRMEVGVGEVDELGAGGRLGVGLADWLVDPVPEGRSVGAVRLVGLDFALLCLAGEVPAAVLDPLPGAVVDELDGAVLLGDVDEDDVGPVVGQVLHGSGPSASDPVGQEHDGAAASCSARLTTSPSSATDDPARLAARPFSRPCRSASVDRCRLAQCFRSDSCW
jgi:hypothetical protein